MYVEWTMSMAQMPLTTGAAGSVTGVQVAPPSAVWYSGTSSLTPGKYSVPMLPSRPWSASRKPSART
jgi:hypothetical protein